ncbi:uncharacterized protein [Rutidosis leptorrhynchoides]|uniref:uncharacterized protein n=1 Tax=Rutidosis leptorrhynchoides TaxID=125765 RepID=UPI003A9933EF
MSLGFSINATVADISHIASWPSSWNHKYSSMATVAIPTVHDNLDHIRWKHIDGSLHDFSVSLVWDCIRPRSNIVVWFSVVWFSQCIPRHAFLMWLSMGERLKTKDRLKAWEVSNGSILLCPLCKCCDDSHSHLFFECTYSCYVWDRAKQLIRIPMDSNKWHEITSTLTPIAVRNVSFVIVVKLVFVASVYFIWQERNNRIFKKAHRTEVKLFDDIFSMVRLKLLSIRFKSLKGVDVMKIIGACKPQGPMLKEGAEVALKWHQCDSMTDVMDKSGLSITPSCNAFDFQAHP